MAELRLTRRTAVLAAATAAATAGVTAVAGPAAAAGGKGLPAVPAAVFSDSVGVQTHLSYTDTPYADLASVGRALLDLGIHHVRDDLVLDHPALYAALNQLAALGIGSDLITGSPGDAGAAAYAAVVAQQLTRVDSVEGTNEWDIRGGADWATTVYRRQADLFSAMRADPRTARIPVLGPALAYLTNTPQLDAVGPLSAVADGANAHAYGGGQPLPGAVGGVRAVMATSQPGQPITLSETGYHDATHGPPGHPSITDAVAATYVPRVFLDAFTGGIARTYLYELLDEWVDPSLTLHEAHFGLLRHDFSPKPAYLSLRTLLRLAEDADGAFATRPLRISADGPADLRHLVLQKRDGTHLLVLWRSVALMKRQHTVDVRPVPVRLRLRRPTAVRVYRPASGSVPVSSARTRGLTVTMGGEIAVLAIGRARHDFLRPIDPEPPTRVKARRTRGGVLVSWPRPAYRTAQAWQVRVGSRSVSVPGDRRSVLVPAHGATARVRAVAGGRASAYGEAAVRG